MIRHGVTAFAVSCVVCLTAPAQTACAKATWAQTRAVGTELAFEPHTPRVVTVTSAGRHDGVVNRFEQRRGVGLGHGSLWVRPEVARFGVAEADLYARVPVRVGGTQISVSAWHQIGRTGEAGRETARQRWLALHGYTGAVRTLVHPSVQAAHEQDAASHVAGPRATIRLPVGQGRERSRGGAELMVRGGRMSLPWYASDSGSATARK